MLSKRIDIALIALGTVLLSACSTVKMPNIDVPGLPEFKEAAAKLVDGYPEVSEAPVRPKDLRSSADWDKAVKSLVMERDNFAAPAVGSGPVTPQEVTSEIEQLKAQVRSYKLDDPQ